MLAGRPERFQAVLPFPQIGDFQPLVENFLRPRYVAGVQRRSGFIEPDAPTTALRRVQTVHNGQCVTSKADRDVRCTVCPRLL